MCWPPPCHTVTQNTVSSPWIQFENEPINDSYCPSSVIQSSGWPHAFIQTVSNLVSRIGQGTEITEERLIVLAKERIKLVRQTVIEAAEQLHEFFRTRVIRPLEPGMREGLHPSTRALPNV